MAQTYPAKSSKKKDSLRFREESFFAENSALGVSRHAPDKSPAV